MFESSVIQEITIMALPFLFAVTLHEMAHGWVALKRGDTTARDMGRITLNPLAHIDPFGTILLPLLLRLMNVPILMGYAKPVPVNAYNFKDPKRDMALVAAAGPSMNLLMAVLSGLLYRILKYIFPLILFSFDQGSTGFNVTAGFFEPLILMFEFAVTLNIFFMFINLIPILPLDGGRVLAGMLPDKHLEWFSKIEPYGIFVLMFLFILNPFNILTRFFFPFVWSIAFTILGLSY